MAEGKRHIGTMNTIIVISPAKEQNSMSNAELTEENIGELPDKDFKTIITKFFKNNEKHIQEFKELKEYATQGCKIQTFL